MAKRKPNRRGYLATDIPRVIYLDNSAVARKYGRGVGCCVDLAIDPVTARRCIWLVIVIVLLRAGVPIHVPL
jgi:hypothetical protein